METPESDQGTTKGMIRHRQTELYYKGDGTWTADSREAMQFENLSNVVSEAQKFGLGDCCEFVVELDGQIGFRVRLPL
jgi:hypothetical protein